MFLKNYWYVAAASDEIGQKPLGRTLLGEPVVLVRFQDGTLGAYEDACPHRRVPLSKGRITENGLMCGYHGLTFDEGGRCVLAPHDNRIPPLAKLVKYPVVERFGWVWIWMGDQPAESLDAVDQVLAPYFPPDAIHGYGYHHVRCNFELITDNLLDLSHVSIVHAGTLGTGNPRIADVVDEVDGSRVKLFRYVRNSECPPYLAPQLGHLDRIDEISEMIWEPPARMAIRVGGAEPGSTLDASGAYVYNIDLVTPETESTSHYFWTIGRRAEEDDPAVTSQMVAMVRTAFDEDVELLEAQQQRLPGGEIRGLRLAWCREDQAPMRARAVLDRVRRDGERMEDQPQAAE